MVRFFVVGLVLWFCVLFVAGPMIAEAQSAATPVQGGTNCTLSWTNLSSLFNMWCWGRSIGAFIDGLLVFMASWLLTVAGVLFNWLVDHTVIHFGDAIYANIKTAVETAWSAFRDIANIFIIGIFTFIAISIILGLKEFGQKKMIAKVLIIAVLINFSLLFTKIVIDTSNFAALQLFNAANGQIASASGAQMANQGENPGIAGAFVAYMGVSGFSDTRAAVANLADNLDSGFTAFLHGFFAATLLLGAAVVLLYGSFLLIARAVLLIFLLVTASIAFASYLWPAWEKSHYGWDAWKDSLVKCAAFAPILMFFLWMTLTVANSMKATNGTLGDLVSNPTKTLDVSALFSYLIILGLLFTSFKLSNIFAGKIAGFNYASMVPGIGVGIAGALTGFVGRNTLGRGASAAGNALRRYYNRRDYDAQGNLVGDYRERQMGLRGILNRAAMRSAFGIAGSTLNPLKAKPGATAGAVGQVPKVFLGKEALGGTSFDEKMKEKAKRADDLARKIGPTDVQRAQNLRLAEGETRRARREQVTNMERLIQTQEATRDELRNRQPGARDTERELTEARQALVGRERERDIAAEEHASRIRIAEARAANIQDPAARQGADAEVQRLQRERREAMAGEAQRIEAARQVVTQRQQTLDQNHPEIAELTRTIETNTRALGDRNRPEPGTLRHGALDAQVTAAARAAERREDVALRESLLWDPGAAPKIEGEMRAHGRRQLLGDIRASQREEGQAERLPGGRAAPPAAPAAPAAPGGGH